MGTWAEQEIILPNGPFAHEQYRHIRHPISRLWFKALESGWWSRYAATGPTQNGKTLMCYVIPVLYHVFEVGETVIVGLPTMDMANDKWQQDFRPVIEASNYADLLPLRGEGSKGGQVKRSITFRNGATLRFMTAGGSDKQRAGYTSRVVAVTETDGMDEPGETSREADKIEQLEGRTRAFGRLGKRIYLECTVSIERGRIWQEIKGGTDSRIARPCPHCGAFVTPEREHLRGWEEAASEEEAAERSAFHCPACGEAWTEEQRVKAWEPAVLVHAGQEVLPSGEVTGPLPKTQTLGFRWSAIDNPFVTAADLGAEEWKARRSADRENAEKKMRQFVWAIPYESPDVEMTPLNPAELCERRSAFKRGVVPSDCLGVAVQVDTGKYKLHWEAKAVRLNGDAYDLFTIDYGMQKTEAEKLGMFHGLLKAFRDLQTYLEKGWQTEAGGAVVPSQVWIDSGYSEHQAAVYAICAEANKGLAYGKERYRPTKGYGEGQRNMSRYISPSKHKDKDILYIGREYYIAGVRVQGKLLPGVTLVHVNSDFWKSEVHQRLAMPKDSPGSIRLFETASTYEHADWSAHQVSERQLEKFIPGKGSVLTWHRDVRENHHLDTNYGSAAGCDFVVSLSRAPQKQKPSERPTAAQLKARVKA